MPPLHLHDIPTSFLNVSTQTNLSIGISKLDSHSGTTVRPLSATCESNQSNNDTRTFQQKVYERLHPKSRGDVKQMYSEVKRWQEYKLNEIDRDETINSDERKRRKHALLTKETILLRKIEALDKGLTQKAGDLAKKQQLDSMSNDGKLWTMSNGEKILVETPASRRTAKLIKIYKRLATFDGQNGTFFHTVVFKIIVSFHIHIDRLILRTDSNIATERLEVLAASKRLVDTINVPATKELIELINRECDMLNRSMTCSLSGLRTRSLNLFLRIIEDERNDI